MQFPLLLQRCLNVSHERIYIYFPHDAAVFGYSVKRRFLSPIFSRAGLIAQLAGLIQDLENNKTDVLAEM